jgi:hypothetical protein
MRLHVTRCDLTMAEENGPGGDAALTSQKRTYFAGRGSSEPNLRVDDDTPGVAQRRVARFTAKLAGRDFTGLI